jgi:hypothetical protein
MKIRIHYDFKDVTGVGDVKVTNLDGTDVTDSFIVEPYIWCTFLDKNLEV